MSSQRFAAAGTCFCVAVLLCATGCYSLVGHPDAAVNGGEFWRDDPLTAVTPRTEADRSVWLRVRTGEADGHTVQVLAGRIRQVLRDEGWRIEESRSRAGVWLDLDIRYWGPNPVRDEAASSYEKVLRARRPDQLDDGETPRGGRFTAWTLLRPEAVLSTLVADVVEYDCILDCQVMRRGATRNTQEKQTLVVWVRKVDLGAEEAAFAIGGRVSDALREVFRNRGPG